jgi:ribonuclease PH
MLPRCSPQRIQREGAKGKSGRTQEIQRLIGRSLRVVTDMGRLGERTLLIDCDVIQADGGTRTAAITGAFIAMADACRGLVSQKLIPALPLNDYVAAVSVGHVGGELLLDLAYTEDSRAEVDMNVIMTGAGGLVEVQGTAEKEPYSREQLNAMLDLAQSGIQKLISAQKDQLGSLR